MEDVAIHPSAVMVVVVAMSVRKRNGPRGCSVFAALFAEERKMDHLQIVVCYRNYSGQYVGIAETLALSFGLRRPNREGTYGAIDQRGFHVSGRIIDISDLPRLRWTVQQ